MRLFPCREAAVFNLVVTILVGAISALCAAATSMDAANLLQAPWASQLGWNASRDMYMCIDWTGVICNGSDVAEL